MNIYGKLQGMRCQLQGMKLNKSGKNKFAGYEYFELQDIIPVINSLMKDYEVTSVLCFEPALATLTLVNIEKPDEKIVFTSPMADAVLKGCQPAQNLGATETYIRRYLYINAFEIVEHDALDSVTGKNGNATPKSEIETKEQQVLSAEIADAFKQATSIQELGAAFNLYQDKLETLTEGLKGWLRTEFMDKQTKLKKARK